MFEGNFSDWDILGTHWQRFNHAGHSIFAVVLSQATVLLREANLANQTILKPSSLPINGAFVYQISMSFCCRTPFQIHPNTGTSLKANACC
jgi:hypothetical protein